MIPASRVRKSMAGYAQVFSYVNCPPPTHVVHLLPKFLTLSLVNPHTSVTRSPVRTGESNEREPSAVEKSDMYVSWRRCLNSLYFVRGMERVVAYVMMSTEQSVIHFLYLKWGRLPLHPPDFRPQMAHLLFFGRPKSIITWK
jgi:hypothetical protein